MRTGCFVYLMRMPDYLPDIPLSSRIRADEVESARNMHRKRELYFGWRLLEYGAYDAFGVRLCETDGERTKNGAVMLPGIFGSVTHSGDILGAALCAEPVGIDIERFSRGAAVIRTAKRILTEEEKSAAPDPENEQAYRDYLIRCWCGKESLFKRTGGAFFDPLAFDTVNEMSRLFSHSLTAGEERAQLCVCPGEEAGPLALRALFWEKESAGGKNTDISGNIQSFLGRPFVL